MADNTPEQEKQAAAAAAEKKTETTPSGNWQFPDIPGHLKNRGHLWVIILMLGTGGFYFWRAKTILKLSEQALTTNVTLTLVSTAAASSSLISLIVLALLSAADCGKLAEFRTPLVIGLVIGLALAAIKLLYLFEPTWAPIPAP